MKTSIFELNRKIEGHKKRRNRLRESMLKGTQIRNFEKRVASHTKAIRNLKRRKERLLQMPIVTAKVRLTESEISLVDQTIDKFLDEELRKQNGFVSTYLAVFGEEA